MMHSNKIKLAVLSVIVVLVLSCRFLVPFSAARLLVASLGYWIMLVGAGVYGYQLVRFLKHRRIDRFFRVHWVGLLVSLLGTLFLEVHEPRQFKVQFDEFTISGVARNMHFRREATFATKAHNIMDELVVYAAVVDKRPLFFQFVLTCIHDLTGYRPSNVFILNGIAAFLLLFLTYYFGVQYGGKHLGLACVGLWLGLPLLAQCATSGGYDVFNLVMIMFWWYFGREYLRSGSTDSQSLFVLTTVHLAQVRYESILFLVPMALTILMRWYRERQIQLGWWMVFCPFFLVLPLLINSVFIHTPVFTQTSQSQAFFGLQYLQGNVEKAIWYLFNVSFSTTNSAVLSVVGTISLVAFCVKIGSRWRKLLEQDNDVLLVLLSAIVISNAVLVFSNYWGQLDDPVASRFALPLHLMFICCFAWVVQGWRRDSHMPLWMFSVIGLAIVLAVPAAAVNSSTRMLVQGREFAWFFNEIGTPAHRNALIISNPIGPILYNHPAIDFDVAEKNKWKINECIKNQIYPEILVLERWSTNFRTGEEVPYSENRIMDLNNKGMIGGENATALGGAFKKEKIAEIRLRQNVITRISRIVGVDGEEGKPPEAYQNEKYPFETREAFYQHQFSALP